MRTPGEARRYPKGVISKCDIKPKMEAYYQERGRENRTAEMRNVSSRNSWVKRCRGTNRSMRIHRPKSLDDAIAIQTDRRKNCATRISRANPQHLPALSVVLCRSTALLFTVRHAYKSYRPVQNYRIQASLKKAS